MENTIFGNEFEIAWRGWEAKQNHKGVIYYVNEAKQITNWNHPFLNKILEDLNFKYGEIKYSAYRTALKLRELQSKIGLGWIQLSAIRHVFAASHRDEADDDQLCYSQVLALIGEALHFSDRQHHHVEHLPTAANLILNLMMNLYDVNHNGQILKRSLRTALTIMCSAQLIEKYRQFSVLVNDESNTVCKRKLYNLLDDLAQFVYVIKEGESFGKCVAATSDNCFRMAQDPNTRKVSYEGFCAWLMMEPQMIVWLPTLHRILASEAVQHNVCCRVCNTVPIVGMRYRCLQCLKYDLCQGCFLHGHTSQAHELKHPVAEYCFPTSVKEETKALLRIMKNKLSKKHRLQQAAKFMYLPVDASPQHTSVQDWQIGSIQSSSSTSTDSGLANGSECEDTDKETQHKQMLLKMEQLQKENMILQERLNTVQKHVHVEFADASSDVDQLNDKPQQEMPYNDPISPIVTARFCPDASESSLVENRDSYKSNDEQPDVLDIIGAFTPIGHDQSCKLSQVSQTKVNGKPKDLQVRIRQARPSQPCELCYHSDYENSCSKVNNEASQHKPNNFMETTRGKDSTLSFGLAYRSSDMTVNFQDIYEDSQVQDSDLLESKNLLLEYTQQAGTSHRAPGKGLFIIPHEAKVSSQLHSQKAFRRSSHKSFHSLTLISSNSLQLSSDSANYSGNKVSSYSLCEEQNRFGHNYSKASEQYNNIELSEIFQDGQTLYHIESAPLPAEIHTVPQRNTMEPVHMSTPINECKPHFMRHHLAGRRFAGSWPSSKTCSTDLDKENLMLMSSNNHTSHGASITPCTTTPWYRKRVLMSLNSVASDHSYTESAGGSGDLSSFFRKAKHIGDKISEATSQTMTTLERQEFEKMMINFRKQCRSSDSIYSMECDFAKKRANANERMLEAALNIGDAMAGLVEATRL